MLWYLNMEYNIMIFCVDDNVNYFKVNLKYMIVINRCVGIE